MEEIFLRRSIRKFTDKEISNDEINKILKAGMNAPSSYNKKLWEFIVIDDREVLDKLSQMHSVSFMLKTSNKAIVVIGKEETLFWQHDLAASTQNMLLMATSLDIGSCWIGVAPEDEKESYVKRVLDIPKDVRVLSMIALGYSETKKEANDNFFKEKVHYNKY